MIDINNDKYYTLPEAVYNNAKEVKNLNTILTDIQSKIEEIKNMHLDNSGLDSKIREWEQTMANYEDQNRDYHTNTNQAIDEINAMFQKFKTDFKDVDVSEIEKKLSDMNTKLSTLGSDYQTLDEKVDTKISDLDLKVQSFMLQQKPSVELKSTKIEFHSKYRRTVEIPVTHDWMFGIVELRHSSNRYHGNDRIARQDMILFTPDSKYLNSTLSSINANSENIIHNAELSVTTTSNMLTLNIIKIGYTGVIGGGYTEQVDTITEDNIGDSSAYGDCYGIRSVTLFYND